MGDADEKDGQEELRDALSKVVFNSVLTFQNS
jgi:hypothetical protein